MRYKITPEQRLKVMELRRKGLTRALIACELGMTSHQVKYAIEKLEGVREIYKNRRRAAIVGALERPIVTIDAMADRDRRLALSPRDLTAALLSDPLPGYSALDRMRASK